MRVPIGEVIEHAVGGGWGYDESTVTTDEVLIIRGADFPSLEIQSLDGVPLRHEEMSKVPQRTLKAGDIILEISGGTKGRPTGRTVFVSDAVLAQAQVPVIPASFCRLVRIDRSKADPRFAFYALQDLYGRGGTWEFQNQSTGLSNFQFSLFQRNYCLPDIEMSQQRGIAEVLGALDDKIAANTRCTSVGLDLAASLVRQASTQASSVALSEVTELVTRGITPRYVEQDDCPVVLNQKCVRGERVLLGPSRRTTTATLRGDKLLRHGDVLVNSTGQGTLGRVARWTGTGTVTVDSHITIVRFDDTKVDRTFAGFAVLPLASAIEALAEGSTGQTELRRGQLLDLPLKLPQPEVQRGVGRLLTGLASSADALEVASERLAATRDALLPLLMSGRVTVKDAESVVGEVL